MYKLIRESCNLLKGLIRCKIKHLFYFFSHIKLTNFFSGYFLGSIEKQILFFLNILIIDKIISDGIKSSSYLSLKPCRPRWPRGGMVT